MIPGYLKPSWQHQRMIKTGERLSKVSWKFRDDIDGLWTLRAGRCERCFERCHRISIGFEQRLHRDCGDQRWREYFAELGRDKADVIRRPGEAPLELDHD